ncbi:MAG: hypothetical protein AAF328_08780 [Planctomycetota bacterium]
MKFDYVRQRCSAVRALALRLHRDDRGAEALEKLLIVAVVVLPLLGVLIYFRGAINDWVVENWEGVRTSEGANDVTNPTPISTGGG